jgi:hypothetical protein
MPELRIAQCLSCKSPEALDVRHAYGQGAFDREQNTTPNGTPISCCRVKTLGADMPKSPAAPSPGGLFSFSGRRSAGGWPWNRPPPLRRSPTS